MPTECGGVGSDVKVDIRATLTDVITKHDLHCAVRYKLVNQIIRLITNEQLPYDVLMDILHKHQHFSLQSSLQQLSAADRLVETLLQMLFLAFDQCAFKQDHDRLLQKARGAQRLRIDSVAGDSDDAILIRQSKKQKMNKVKRTTATLCKAYHTLHNLAQPIIDVCINQKFKTKEELEDHWETVLTHELFDSRALEVADAVSELCTACDIGWSSATLLDGPGLTDGLSTIIHTSKIIMDVVWYMPRSGNAGEWYTGLLLPIDYKWPGAISSKTPSKDDTEFVPGVFCDTKKRKRPRGAQTANVPPSLVSELSVLQTNSAYSPSTRLFSPQRDFYFDQDAQTQAWTLGVQALSGVTTTSEGDIGSLPRTDVIHDNGQLTWDPPHPKGVKKPLCAMNSMKRCVASLLRASPGALPPYLTPTEEATYQATGVFPRPNGLCLLCLRHRYEQIVLFCRDRVQNPANQHARLLLPPAQVSVNEPGGYRDKYIVKDPMAAAAFPGVSNTLQVRFAADVKRWYICQGDMVFTGNPSSALN